MSWVTLVGICFLAAYLVERRHVAAAGLVAFVMSLDMLIVDASRDPVSDADVIESDIVGFALGVAAMNLLARFIADRKREAGGKVWKGLDAVVGWPIRVFQGLYIAGAYVGFARHSQMDGRMNVLVNLMNGLAFNLLLI